MSSTSTWKEEQRALAARARQIRIHPARDRAKPGTILQYSDRLLQVTETGALQRVQLTPGLRPEVPNPFGSNHTDL